MSYQEFHKKRVLICKPKMVMRKKGILWINSAALQQFFNEVERVRLFWDAENQKIGFKSAKGKKETFSISRTKGRDDANIAILSLLRFYDIKIQIGKIFTPTWNDKEKLVEITLGE